MGSSNSQTDFNSTEGLSASTYTQNLIISYLKFFVSNDWQYFQISTMIKSVVNSFLHKY